MSAKSVEVGQWGAHCPCLDDPPRPSPMLLYPVGFRAHTHLPPAHDYLLLQVHSAKHLAPARLNGSSDPFCVVVVDNETARTKPQKGACLPACLPACPGLASLFVACPPTLPLPLPVIPPPSLPAPTGQLDPEWNETFTFSGEAILRADLLLEFEAWSFDDLADDFLGQVISWHACMPNTGP